MAIVFLSYDHEDSALAAPLVQMLEKAGHTVMAVAKRIGLVEYWRSSNKWSNFCSEPKLPYDCKVEAAKYA